MDPITLILAGGVAAMMLFNGGRPPGSGGLQIK